jgi:hypothetical protein
MSSLSPEAGRLRDPDGFVIVIARPDGECAP